MSIGSVGRFIVRNVLYDYSSEDSDGDFDIDSFNGCGLPLSQPSDYSCTNQLDANHKETDYIKSSTAQYNIKVPPIIIPLTPSSASAPSTSSNSASASISITPSDSKSASDTPLSLSNIIHFDTFCDQCLIASHGFDSGCHEWTVKILNTDLLHQEIGVVSNYFCPPQNNGAIRDNDNFGARAVYGNNKETSYYASYNMDNSCRCNKILPSTVKPWCNGDEVKINLDLEKGCITFFLNDNKVRKSLSVQRNRMYYPIISSSVNCIYEVVHYERKKYM